ncbi:MAG: hypothetical protein QXY62_03020, partial [Candidatus Altiarchaeota archaeon]
MPQENNPKNLVKNLIGLAFLLLLLTGPLIVSVNSQTSCPDPCTKFQSDNEERRCDPTGKIVQECYPLTGKNCYNWMAVEDCSLKGKVCKNAQCIDAPKPQTCKEAGGSCKPTKCLYTED